jgi:hypothetical protein
MSFWAAGFPAALFHGAVGTRFAALMLRSKSAAKSLRRSVYFRPM